MKQLASICCHLLIAVGGLTFVSVQETIEDSSVAAIEKKAESGIAELDSELTQQLEELIREATKNSDFDRTATLVEERQRWLEEAQMPRSEKTKARLKSHFHDREKLIKMIQLEFESEIQRLTQLRRFEDAKSVRERMQNVADSFPTQASASAMEAVHSDDPAAMSAVESHQSFCDRYAQAIKKIEKTVRQNLEDAVAEGNLSKVEIMRDDLSQLKEGLPVDPKSEVARRNVRSEVSRLKSQLKTRNRKLVHAIEKVGQAKEITLANQLTALLFDPRFQRLQRWKVLFRSNEPKVWNTQSDQWDAWAIPCSSAPDKMKFLKLTRTDTGDFVIIPLTNKELTKISDRPPIRWGGDKYERAKVRHLGISRLDVRPGQKGYVVIGADGFTGYTGWGFGHRHNIDDGLWCAWNGNPISPVIMEIAVTDENLTTSEKRRLLLKAD